MARYEYDLTIIGGGSGGLMAAWLAHALGARVALVERQRLGGDCLHYGCVPSKSLISLANLVHQARHAAALGLVRAESTVDMAQINAVIQQVIARVANDEQRYVAGVDVRFGAFRFCSAHAGLIDGMPITSRCFIIATGSRPAIPPIAGLTEIGYLTNEQVFDVRCLPPRLAIIGGGPVGVELAQAVARLGAGVTLFQAAALLPKEDADVSHAIDAALRRDGVAVYTHARVRRVWRDGSDKVVEATLGKRTLEVRADDILLAAGRVPNVAGLGLEAAGVSYDERGGIAVDAYLRSSCPTISAIGDVIGGPMFTHVAAHHAGVAVRNQLIPFSRARGEASILPWVTFCDPEVARVGLTEAQARQQAPVRIIRLPWRAIDRAQMEGQTSGFIKLVLHAHRDIILGAHLVGAHSGELVGELALAMQHRLGLNAVLATIHAYPTYSTGIQQIAVEALCDSRTFAIVRRLLRAFLVWRG